MKIGFHGAARTVTGSKHLIHINPDKKILLDCGMFQGMGRDTMRLNSDWGFDPTEINYVVISHAHIDHIGLLPKLVNDGFKGKIFCTTATESLVRLLLLDSAHIQEADVKYVNRRREREGKDLLDPLYTIEDVYKVFPLLNMIEYNIPFKIDEDVELLYTDCGHILGSAAVNLKIREHGKEVTLTFSGDIGRYRDMILRSPDIFPQADYIIMESTYGDKLHDMVAPSADKLLEFIEHTCIRKRGKLIIPAFSVGRTQEVLYLLNRLENENRLPKVNYYVDSPMSIEATEIIKRHPQCFNKDVQELLRRDEDVFGFRGLHYIRNVEDSIKLNESREPAVIISASGMAEAGRVKHHIKHAIGDVANTILMVGYAEPTSLGARLKNGAESVTIFGVQYTVKAEVGSIDSLSAHGDYDDMSQWLACQDASQVRKLFLVHGEYEVQVKFRERLIRKGFRDIEIPDQHQVIGLGSLD
jgi:metallo-beta-lactamase family protein